MNNNHFLQSDAWKKFQESIGRKTFQETGTNWSFLAIEEKSKFDCRLYTPYGPIFSDYAAFKSALTKLKSIAKDNNIDFIRIEPTQNITEAQLTKLGFKKVTYNHLQPSDTQVVDLNLPLDKLYLQMDQPTRNRIRNYSKKGLSVHYSYNPDDIAILISLLKKVSKRNNFRMHQENYYYKQAAALMPDHSAALYYVLYENKPIAASLVYDSKTTRYYAHAAADDNYRKLNANTALVGQMILDAKDKGLKYFDLYGITLSTDPNHPWHGFTIFKKSFGGQTVNYLGAWDLPLNKFKYNVYRFYQTTRHFIRNHL